MVLLKNVIAIPAVTVPPEAPATNEMVLNPTLTVPIATGDAITGVKIVSPMTPKEYMRIYKSYLKDDDVYYVSEHRGSYANKNELPDIIYKKPDLVIKKILRSSISDLICKGVLPKYYLSLIHI